MSEQIEQARADGRSALTEPEGKALAPQFGVVVPQTVLVSPKEDLRAALKGMSPPFVVKVVSPDILHKSDAGGVKVGLTDHAAVSEAVQDMAAIPAIASANVEGYLVEEMAPAGQEIVIGGLNDSQFGPMVMVGLGGVFVETLKDVAFRLCPISEVDAHAMLAELKGKAILEGARGSQAVSLDAIVKALLNVGGKDGLMDRYGNDIEELDINPLIVNAESAVAVDARVILSAKPEPEATAQTNDAVPPIERFRPLFEPKTIAVIGASTTSSIIANTFIRRMKAYGYDGDIYPIHPKADEIEGLKAYPDLGQTPKPIDYAYVATRADRIPDMIGAAKGNVKFAQVISSGFAKSMKALRLKPICCVKRKQRVPSHRTELSRSLLAARQSNIPGRCAEGIGHCWRCHAKRRTWHRHYQTGTMARPAVQRIPNRRQLCGYRSGRYARVLSGTPKQLLLVSISKISAMGGVSLNC